MNKDNKPYFVVIVVLAIAIIIFCTVKYCQTPKNIVVDSTGRPKPDVVEVIKLTDSTQGYGQNTVITDDPVIMKKWQDSIQAVLNRKLKLDPKVIVRYEQNIELLNKVGQYKNELDLLIDSTLEQKQIIAQYQSIKDRLLLTPAPYEIKGKSFTQKGMIRSDGTITLDSMSIYSEPIITVGEKNRLFGRSTLAISVMDKNPDVKISNLASYQYVPKPKRWGITAGPGVFATPKGLTYGIGITAGYTISIK